MSKVGGVGHHLSCTTRGPELVEIAANHLLSRTNYILQSVLVLGSGSMPDDDGGGEDELML